MAEIAVLSEIKLSIVMLSKDRFENKRIDEMTSRFYLVIPGLDN